VRRRGVDDVRLPHAEPERFHARLHFRDHPLLDDAMLR